jgi:hypothetical protein
MASEHAITRNALGLHRVSDNVHVDAPLFCVAWRFRSIFSSQWQVDNPEGTRCEHFLWRLNSHDDLNGHKGDSLIRREPL